MPLLPACGRPGGECAGSLQPESWPAESLRLSLSSLLSLSAGGKGRYRGERLGEFVLLHSYMDCSHSSEKGITP